jgi:hypothetical protein
MLYLYYNVEWPDSHVFELNMDYGYEINTDDQELKNTFLRTRVRPLI